MAALGAHLVLIPCLAEAVVATGMALPVLAEIRYGAAPAVVVDIQQVG